MKSFALALISASVVLGNDPVDCPYDSNPGNCWVNGCHDATSVETSLPNEKVYYMDCFFPTLFANFQTRRDLLYNMQYSKILAQERYDADVRRLTWCEQAFYNSNADTTSQAVDPLDRYSVSNYDNLVAQYFSTNGLLAAKPNGSTYIDLTRSWYQTWCNRDDTLVNCPTEPNDSVVANYWRQWLPTAAQESLQSQLDAALEARTIALGSITGGSNQKGANYDDWVNAYTQYASDYEVARTNACAKRAAEQWRTFLGSNPRDVDGAADRASTQLGQQTTSAASLDSTMRQDGSTFVQKSAEYVRNYYSDMENEAEVAARSSGVQGAVPDFATTQRDKESTTPPTRVPVDWQTASTDATNADNSYKANYNAYVEACALEQQSSFVSTTKSYWSAYDQTVAAALNAIDQGGNTYKWNSSSASFNNPLYGGSNLSVLTQFCNNMESAANDQSRIETAVNSLADQFDSVSTSQKASYDQAIANAKQTIASANGDPNQISSAYNTVSNFKTQSVVSANVFPDSRQVDELNWVIDWMGRNRLQLETCNIGGYTGQIANAVNTNIIAWYNQYSREFNDIARTYQQSQFDVQRQAILDAANESVVGSVCANYAAQAGQWQQTTNSSKGVEGCASTDCFDLVDDTNAYLASQEFQLRIDCQNAKIQAARYTSKEAIHALVNAAQGQGGWANADTYEKPTEVCTGDPTRYIERLHEIDLRIEELEARRQESVTFPTCTTSKTSFLDFITLNAAASNAKLDVELRLLANERHDIEAWQAYFAGDCEVTRRYTLNPITQLDVSDTSLIVFEFVTEDLGNLWTQFGSYSTSARYGDEALVDTTCPTSEEDYWSKAGQLTWFNNTSTVPNGVSEFRNNETIWNDDIVSSFFTCTGVSWTNSLPVTNWENDPNLVLDVSTPSYSASSYSGSVSGLYRTYFSAHDTWYNAQVAFNNWDSERAYSARDNQAIFEGAQADYEACQVAQFSNADYQAALTFNQREADRLQLEIDDKRAECFSLDRTTQRCNNDPANFGWDFDFRDAYYMREDFFTWNQTGSTLETYLNDTVRDSMIVPPDNNLTAIMKDRLYNETSGLGDTFINQINNDTYNDFWRVAVAVPNWNRDACNYYNIFNAQIKPCISQAALLSAAEYPKPLKNKDFAWANAIVICLDILGAVMVAVLAMAVMMRCRSKRAGASNEMRSVRGADMGPGDRDHSQMDLNGPSQNDVSADVGFNTGAQGSALISNKSTPGANVSVEPATQQNGAPSENSQNAGQQKDVVAELEEIL